MSNFVQKKSISGEFYCTTLLNKNLQLKHIEFFLRFTTTMLYRKQDAEIALDASKISILMLKIHKALEALVHEDSCETLAELAESLGVDHTTVSKRLKAIGIIKKQCH
ncbi:hypothetical protein AVEN_208235-1 [Araneus ventricosus]|uniref:HTH iclR-type domain-containing protein n=1 Tax=Araneus ventricosus TaxID=182803 RepID=A0A4Y2RC88_ARAVE|nr:hypothetical protein AVEN_241070-1 [Araneus ventricosus]GBN73076.1 hypothetical protein AVEN_208235-1 [Araneus ventricosus]